MRNLIYILVFITVFFTACTNTLNPQYLKKDDKKELIQKANTGNVQAMIELNRVYLFPQTKEGLELYKRWYDIVLQSENYEDILSFAKINKKYKDLFINGEQKHINLLKRAFELKNDKGLAELLNYYISTYYTRDEEKKIQEKIFLSKNKDDIETLYNTYIINDKHIMAKKIELDMKELGLKPTIFSDYLKILSIYHKKEKKAEYEATIEKILKSNNYALIKKTAKFLEYRKRKKALELYEKAILLNKKDVEAHLKIVKIYKKIDRKNLVPIIQSLKKAVLLDNYKATEQILEIYLRDKKYLDDYLVLKKELLKLSEAKRAYANFLYRYINKNEGIKLLEELALNDNANAIIDLATIKKSYSRYYDIQRIELIKKWQNFIIKSEKPYLISMLRKKLQKDRVLRKEYKTLIKQLEQSEIKQENIYTLRELYSRHNIKDKELLASYIQKASSLGDTKTTLALAKKNFYLPDIQKVKKAIALYDDLANKGEIQALEILAKFYRDPKYFNSKINADEIKDINKSIKYYEKLLTFDKQKATRELINIYLCTTCTDEKKNVEYEKKASFYINKLIEQKDAIQIYKIANLFYDGLKEKKDINKSIYYYEKSGELGYLQAYIKLAEIFYENKEYKKAITTLKKAAKKDSKDAISWLGHFYKEGIGVKKDINEAIKYFKQSDTIPYSSYTLGTIYLEKKDYKNTIKYYNKTLEDSYNNFYKAEVAQSLGEIYETGKGVKKDIKKALEYFKKSYKIASTSNSAKSIAKLYEHHIKDLEEANKWYKKAKRIDDRNKR